MYRNIHTGIILTDEEYWSMRKREIQEEWESLHEDERQEWENYEQFEQWDFERNVDLDFEYIES